jgi:hypothetical protein
MGFSAELGGQTHGLGRLPGQAGGDSDLAARVAIRGILPGLGGRVNNYHEVSAATVGGITMAE